jgi:hypothetical protein
MPTKVSTSDRRISSTTTFVLALAFARRAVLAALALAAVSALPAVPSLVLRAFAAASAVRVRSLIRRASSSATAARMCRVSLNAKGWSQATKSTPASISACGGWVPSDALRPPGWTFFWTAGTLERRGAGGLPRSTAVHFGNSTVGPSEAGTPRAVEKRPAPGRHSWRTAYRFRQRFGLPFSACQAIECQQGDSMTDKERNTCGSERPKYPPPPRSGNAFAAAVCAAIPCLLLLVALLWWFT